MSSHRFSGRARLSTNALGPGSVGLPVDRLCFTEGAPYVVDDATERFQALPSLGKNLFERRPLAAGVAGHASTYAR